MEEYLTYFKGSWVKDYSLNPNFRLSPWIDGNNSQIRIRHRYFQDVLDYYSTLAMPSRLSLEILQLLNHLKDQHYGHAPKTEMYHRFVDEKATRENCVVFTNVRSKQILSFVHHLCLTQGKYETELDFTGLGPLECFQKAGLLKYPLRTATQEERLEDCKTITRNYLIKELR